MNNDDDRKDRKEQHDDINLCTSFADKSCVAAFSLGFVESRGGEKIEMALVLVGRFLFDICFFISVFSV